MNDLLVWGAVLAVSLAGLVAAADVFISSGEKVGIAFRMPPFLIGVTIVALGTSLPELISSISAVWNGVSEIAAGTVIGSNVTNILLILSVAAILGRGLRVDYELVRVDLPYLFGSALLLLLFSIDGEIGWMEGVLSLLALAIFLVYAMTSSDGGTATLLAPDVPERQPRVNLWIWLSLVGSGVILQVSAHYTVVAVTRVSGMAGISSAVIAASVIALGTSLPELSVTIRSARKGKPEIAVGNVIGSNIFNGLGVIGLPALLGTITIPTEMLYFGLPCMLGATTLCFFVLQEREMTQWDGYLLMILYIAFTGHLYGVL